MKQAALAVAGALVLALGLSGAIVGLAWFAQTSQTPQGDTDEDLAESIYLTVAGFLVVCAGTAMLAWPLARWRGILFGIVTGTSLASVAAWLFAVTLSAASGHVEDLGQFADAHEFDLALFALRISSHLLGVLAAAGAVAFVRGLTRLRTPATLLASGILALQGAALASLLAGALQPSGVLWPDMGTSAGFALALGVTVWNSVNLGWVGSGGEWRRLLAGVFLPLFTRQEPAASLQHETRRRIMEAVVAEPGLHARALPGRLGIDLGSAVYHLEVLERSGHLYSRRSGRERRYFGTRDVPPEEAIRIAATRHKHAAAIFAEVAAGTTTQVDLARRIGISASLVGWHASRMISAGVISAVRDGRTIRYSVVE